MKKWFHTQTQAKNSHYDHQQRQMVCFETDHDLHSIKDYSNLPLKVKGML